MALHTQKPRAPETFVLSEMFKNGASVDMVVNGSVTPVDFDVVFDRRVQIISLHFELLDAATDPSLFGGLAALTNGVTVKLHDENDVVRFDLTRDEPVKQNADWGTVAGLTESIAVIDSAGVKPDLWGINIDLSEFNLIAYPNWYLRVKISDDLTLLTHFHAVAHGTIY